MIVIDNTVLSNFARTNHLQLLELFCRSRGLIVQSVREEFQRGISRGLFSEIDLSWMNQIDITDPKEIYLSQRYRLELGNGESDCLAIAICRNLELLTEQIEEVRKKFGELIGQYLENGGECRPIKGAICLIDKLLSDQHYKIGFATGGWRHTAKMKLRHAGFDLRNTVLFSSDNSDERVEIMKECLSALGNGFHRIVYVGDAVWDIQATKKLGWHFIGVGPRLKEKCEFWVEDFSNCDTFMRMLHA